MSNIAKNSAPMIEGAFGINEVLKEWTPLVGRILIAILFLPAGIQKIPGWDGTAAYMASHGVPMVSLLLFLTIVIEIVGPLMILFGYRARWAAGIMFLWLIPLTLMMHNFWDADAAQRQVQTIMFFKNVAIMGTMLLIVGMGSGPKSLKND